MYVYIEVITIDISATWLRHLVSPWKYFFNNHREKKHFYLDITTHIYVLELTNNRLIRYINGLFYFDKWFTCVPFAILLNHLKRNNTISGSGLYFKLLYPHVDTNNFLSCQSHNSMWFKWSKENWTTHLSIFCTHAVGHVYSDKLVNFICVATTSMSLWTSSK